MSGIKTTSVFGSLINMAICWTILWALSIKYDYMAVLGDDIDLTFNSVVDFKSIMDCYDDIKFPVAWAKTYYA